jgi:hypothetical protein
MPGTRRIFAGVSGSPGTVHALRQAAQLAHHHDALLIPVLAWLPPDSRRLPWPELRPATGQASKEEMVMSKHQAADTVARCGRSPDSRRWAPWRHARPPAPCATQRSPGRLA